MTLFLLLSSLLGCHIPASLPSSTEGEREALAVTTAVVATQPMPVWVSLTGTLIASQQVQVAADASGVITSVRAERGQRVRKGDVLAEVDSRLTSLSATAGSAQAEAISAQLSAAEADCKRTEQLFSQQVIPQATYERAMAGCQAQRSSLQAARANADLARTNAAKSQIRAPFDGEVGERLVEVGNFVQVASPVVSLYGDGLLRVRFTVPQNQAAQVKFNQRVEVVPSEGPPVPGVVRFLSPALREATRDRVVEAELQPSEQSLLPGMFTEVRLEVAEQERPVVPAAALVGDDTVHRLFLVREGRAFEQVVRVGAEKDGLVAVLSDLQAGDTVVLSPPSGLVDGQKVK